MIARHLATTLPEDPYRWLEDLESPRTQAFIADHERLTRQVLNGVPGRDEWRALLESKIHREQVQSLGGGFHLEQEAGCDRPTLTLHPPGDEPRQLLTPDDWETGASLAFAAPSPTGAYVALGWSERGSDSARIQVLEVATGRLLDRRPIGRHHSHVAWLSDGSGFYYSACPETGEDADHWKSFYRYRLDAPDEAGRCLRVFGDDRVKEYWCAAEVSECGRYALFYKYDFVHACDVYLQRIGDDVLTPVATEMRSLSRVQVIGEQLLIWTDLEAPRGRCCVAPLTAPAEWRTLIPEAENVLQSVTGIGGRIYAVGSRAGCHEVTVHSLDGQFLREVRLPSLGTVNHHDGNGVVNGLTGTWAGGQVRVSFESILVPPATYRYNYDTDQLTPERAPEVSFPASEYVAEQVQYPSTDGVSVPMLLVRHRDAQPDGNQRVRLTGYGGFGIPFESRWNPATAAWLETGGMLAFAGIRGGGEYGKAWHDAARGRNRQHAFDDYIAAARWLVSAGWTEPNRIVSRGNSNGGLMVTVTAMQAPEAFGAVIARAALLNMLEFPRFGFLASATVEYGSPDDPEDAACLAAYSPYHNVRSDQAYPAMLFIAPLNDGISPPYDPLKMTVRLEEEAPQGGPYMLLPLRETGHDGGSTASALVEQNLDELCFCHWALDRLQGP